MRFMSEILFKINIIQKKRVLNLFQQLMDLIIKKNQLPELYNNLKELIKIMYGIDFKFRNFYF